MPVFVSNMWAMHLPRVRVYTGSSRALRKPRSGFNGSGSFFFCFFSGERTRAPVPRRLFRRESRAEEEEARTREMHAQLRHNRGNLYDCAFNRSIKAQSSPRMRDRKTTCPESRARSGEDVRAHSRGDNLKSSRISSIVTYALTSAPRVVAHKKGHKYIARER